MRNGARETRRGREAARARSGAGAKRRGRETARARNGAGFIKNIYPNKSSLKKLLLFLKVLVHKGCRRDFTNPLRKSNESDRSSSNESRLYIDAQIVSLLT